MEGSFMKKLQVMAIIFIILSINLLFTQAERIEKNNSEQLPYLFAFHSYVDIYINTDNLNSPLPIEQNTIVNLTVKYWTDIPNDLFKNLPDFLRNIIFFGSIKKPLQNIVLRVDQPPPEILTYFNQPSLLLEIPYGDESTYANTTLIIQPKSNTSAVSYTIKIEAETQNQIGRLYGIQFEKQVSFTIQFYPAIEITGEQLINSPPDTTQIVPITIKNKGNRISRITGYTNESFHTWDPIVYPTNKEIATDDEFTFLLNVRVPEDFYGLKIENITFHVEGYPYIMENPKLEVDWQITFYNVN